MTWFVSLLIFTTAVHAKLKKVDACEAPKGAKTVMLIKQWHLAPTTVTKGFREKYKQEKNQMHIYRSLHDLVKRKKVQLVVAEGCEGEIDKDFTASFNGWDLASLRKKSKNRSYERIVSHVPLKLEARHGDKLVTVCGDNEKLIQEGNLRLSNLRGWAGFWSRLSEKNDDEKSKLYAEAAATLLKMPAETPVAELQTKIKAQIRQELDFFKKSLLDRNAGFVKALAGREFKQAAIVVGGLHASDLKAKLQEAGYKCEVMEPVGYVPEDEKLIEDFEAALK